MSTKLSSETLEKAIKEVVTHSKETKKRKFRETIELQIALKNFDPARDRRINGSVRLPHIARPNFKVCLLGSAAHCDEAKELGIDYKDEADLKAFNRNKKLVKKLAKSYDAFIASSSLIKKVPRLLGPGLNRAGKFPVVVSPNETVKDKVAEVQATVKFSLKFKVGAPMAMAVAVANVDMTDEEIAQNMHVAVNYMVSLLKKHWNNVKRLHMKSTMGPAHRIYGF